MPTKLIEHIDEASWKQLKTWCSHKGIKIGEGLNHILANFFKNKRIKLSRR